MILYIIDLHRKEQVLQKRLNPSGKHNKAEVTAVISKVNIPETETNGCLHIYSLNSNRWLISKWRTTSILVLI